MSDTEKTDGTFGTGGNESLPAIDESRNSATSVPPKPEGLEGELTPSVSDTPPDFEASVDLPKPNG